MAGKSPPKRDTFRQGNLPEALVNAALARLEAEGVESISLRELARDAGVNHRAVYRHFPDKLSLLALVAETGWKRLGRRLRKSTAGKGQGVRRGRLPNADQGHAVTRLLAKAGVGDR